MRDVLPEVEEWRARGDTVAIATVVDTKGSSPRPRGAKLAINSRGATYWPLFAALARRITDLGHALSEPGLLVAEGLGIVAAPDALAQGLLQLHARREEVGGPMDELWRIVAPARDGGPGNARPPPRRHGC